MSYDELREQYAGQDCKFVNGEYTLWLHFNGATYIERNGEPWPYSFPEDGWEFLERFEY